MLFSIVTPTYQCREFLARCYWSLCEQNYSNWEWLVVDDGSTDGTCEAIAKIQDPRVRYTRFRENRGRGVARMYALEQAKGGWAVLLDADDLSFPDRLEQALAAMKAGYDFMCSALLLIDDRYSITGVRGVKNSGYPRSFTHASLCGDTNLIREIGYPNYPRAQDVRVVLTLANRYKGRFSDDPLYIYHETANGSAKDAFLGQWYYLKELNRLTRSGTIMNCPEVVKMKMVRICKISCLLPILCLPKSYRLTFRMRENFGGVTAGLPPERIDFLARASVRYPSLRRTNQAGVR